MRIVQLITQDRGGPVDHAIDIALELAELGHETHVVGPGGSYTQRINNSGVISHKVQIGNKFDIGGARTLAETLRRLSPDVVHCQDRRAGLIGRMLAKRAGIASVYTLHGVPDPLAHMVPGNLRFAPSSARTVAANKYGERLLARTSHSHVIAPCHALATYATDYIGIPAERVTAIHNGVSPTWGAAESAALCDETSAVTVAWLGVMQPVKRVPDLVSAVAASPDLRLLLIGDGPERSSIELAIAQAGVVDQVTLAGFQTDPAAWLRRAQILALPSAAEACPMALLQAMVCGLPIVATRAGGIPEIVRDGIDGLLVEAGDPIALAEALARLAGNHDLRRRMGASAKARILGEFTTAQCTQKLVATYRAVAI